MQRDSNRLPSVACLLYLAADQIAPRRMSAKMLKATKVPCRPVWVQPIRLSATIAAATNRAKRTTGAAAPLPKGHEAMVADHSGHR